MLAQEVILVNLKTLQYFELKYNDIFIFSVSEVSASHVQINLTFVQCAEYTSQTGYWIHSTVLPPHYSGNKGYYFLSKAKGQESILVSVMQSIHY